MAAAKIHLNGHTCLNCARGHYDGYDAKEKVTRPCPICGHQAPASMTIKAFREKVTERDERLYRS